MTKPILCVDFDGVIHSYSSGWQGADIISDPPVPGALEWLWRATNWFDVQVYSSRSKQLGGCAAMLEWMQSHARMEWEAPHVMRGDVSGLQYPITFCHEKPAAFLTIDDRAICFDGNWPALDPEALLKFRPWNKRAATGAAVSEIETLRAQLAAAERVVEKARAYIMLEWGSLDAAMLSAKRYREGWGAIPDSEIALIESLAAYDQGKVT